MDSEIKALWVAALRSGEYEQGKGALRRGEQFCCLGVLCDLAVKAGAVREIAATCDIANCPAPHNYRYGNETNFLPESVMKWAGTMNTSPQIDGEELAAMNDSGTPFSVIAELIETNL